MKTQTVKISDLKLAKYNPRQISDHDMASLVNSIREFGFVEPVVVNKDNTVIGGHQRIVACKQLAYETVPVVYVDLSKKKEKILNLALNRIHGDWDMEKLAVVLEELELDKKDDISLSGFSEIEISDILDSKLEINENKEDLRPIKKLHILLSMTVNESVKLIPVIEGLIKDTQVEVHYGSN